jgi:hypothetical protein
VESIKIGLRQIIKIDNDMLDKNKLYIICYISISGISDEDVPSHLASITDHITKGYDNSVKFIFIPTRTQDTHIEFFGLNMLKKLNSDEAKAFIEKFETLVNSIK